MWKLGFDAKRAYQNYSGLGNYSRYVLSAMINMYPENAYYLYTPRVKIHFLDHLVEHKKNVTLVDVTSLPKVLHPLWRNIYIPFDLKRKGIQLYHGLSNELPVGISAKIPKVVTIHDLIFMRFPQWYNATDRKIYYHKSLYACRKADRIIAMSEFTKQDIVTYLGISPDKIEVIYQDCDTRFHKIVSDSDKQKVLQKYGLQSPYMLSVGTIEKRKNQLAIVKAFHRLNNKDVQLVLVGRSTSYMNEIQKYIQKHGLGDHVRILNDVTSDDLPALYGEALFSVYISTIEGFGIPILESMYTECPVITTRYSSMQEIAADAALYITQDNVEELTSQMGMMLSQPALRETLIEKSKNRLPLFESKQSIIKMTDIYRTLIEG